MSRSWFITGINSGFGRAMCEQLLARGERVFGTVRAVNAVDDLKARHGAALQVAVLELAPARPQVIAEVVEQAFAQFGRIDVIVNNAGYGLFGPLEGIGEAQLQHQIDTNLLAPIHLTRAALPHLRRQGGGRILALSSYGGQATHPGASLYHASKWGLEGFFDSLGKELAEFGIGVTLVEPGGARTAFRRTAGLQMGQVPEAYRHTALAAMLARLADPVFVAPGDPFKMARAMIDSVDQVPAPARLVLGRDAYQILERALGERLALLQSQQALASSTDVTEDEESGA